MEWAFATSMSRWTARGCSPRSGIRPTGSRKDDHRPVHHVRESGTRRSAKGVRPRPAVARDRRRAPESPRHGDPIWPRPATSWRRRNTPATAGATSRYSGTSENWRRRPRQLSAVLDRLLGDAEFGPRIDPARIGAVGHSAGGYSVLALIGGRADMAVLARHCTQSSRRGPGVLRLWPARRARRRPRCRTSRTDDVGAVVAVAPVGALFGDGAFSGVTVPAQIHRLGRLTGSCASLGTRKTSRP